MLNVDIKDLRDEEVLALAIKRPSVFEALVDKYQAAFLRTAFGVVKNMEEAEDVVQEAFTKIYVNAEKFKKVEGASFKSWAYRIVFNTSITHYQKRKRAGKMSEYFDEAGYDLPAQAGENENFAMGGGVAELESAFDAKKATEAVLAEMPDNLKSVMQKFYLEDKSQKDIAQEENISEVAVKMRLFRAKRVFKKILEDKNNKILCLV